MAKAPSPSDKSGPPPPEFNGIGPDHRNLGGESDKYKSISLYPRHVARVMALMKNGSNFSEKVQEAIDTAYSLTKKAAKPNFSEPGCIGEIENWTRFDFSEVLYNAKTLALHIPDFRTWSRQNAHLRILRDRAYHGKETSIIFSPVDDSPGEDFEIILSHEDYREARDFRAIFTSDRSPSAEHFKLLAAPLSTRPKFFVYSDTLLITSIPSMDTSTWQSEVALVFSPASTAHKIATKSVAGFKVMYDDLIYRPFRVQPDSI